MSICFLSLLDEYERDGRLKWILSQFREVYIYQTPWIQRKTPHRMARVLLQFKEHWKDKQSQRLPRKSSSICCVIIYS